MSNNNNKLTVVICEASETLSNPSSPTHARRAAQNCLANLWKNSHPDELLQSAQQILQSPQQPTTSKFHALLAIRDLFLRRHEDINDRISSVTSFLLNGIFASNNNSPATIIRTLIITVATCLKLLLLPQHAQQQATQQATQQQAQQAQQFMHTLLTMTDSSQSLNILVVFLQQLSKPHGGLTLEIHETCHKTYALLYLDRTMLLASNIVQQNRTDEIGLAALGLLSEILAWDFRFQGSCTLSSLPIFSPPESWKPSLLTMGKQLVHLRTVLPPSGNAQKIVDECLLNLASTHGKIFQNASEQAIFINNLLHGVLHITGDSTLVYTSSTIIAKAFEHCKVDVLASLPKNGAVVVSMCEMMHSSLISLGNLLLGGATVEDVDMLARGIDHLLMTLSNMLHKLQTKQIPRNNNSRSEQPDPLNVQCSLLLNLLSPCCNKMYTTFVAFILSQVPALKSINHHLNDEESFDGNDGGNDGGTVLTDVTSRISRFQMMGVLGRMVPDVTMPLLSKHLINQLNCQPSDLITLANIMNLCSGILVRHNGSNRSPTTVHRLVPAGVRSSSHSLQMIELLLKIISNLTTVWQQRCAPSSQPVGWGLLNLTRESTSCMICFVKVWVDPIVPDNDPLSLELKSSLNKGKSHIVDILIQYVTSILMANGIHGNTSGGNKTKKKTGDVARAIKRDDRLDSQEVQGAMELLHAIVRRHATTLRKSTAWPTLCTYTTHVHDTNEFTQFGRCLSPYTVGKIVEFTTRGCMIAGCCQASFENLTNVLTLCLNSTISLPSTVENESIVLRLLETIRGMSRCSFRRGSNWTEETKTLASTIGWAKSVPLLGMCTGLAKQYATAVPDTLVVVSVARLWSHFLKIYGEKCSSDNFGGIFNELSLLLNTFQLQLNQSSVTVGSSCGDESIHAMVICQFAGLLVSLLMTQKHVIMLAYQNKSSGGSIATTTSSGIGIGDNVVAVVFASVEKLFTCITPNLLQFTKVCDRFVALSCFLVEMFAERLLSGSVESVNAFIACLEFASDSVEEEISTGALDGMASLIHKCIDLNSQHAVLILSRLCRFLLTSLSKEFQNDRAEMLYNMFIQSPQVQSVAHNWSSIHPDRVSKMNQLCQCLSNKEMFLKQASQLRLIQKV